MLGKQVRNAGMGRYIRLGIVLLLCVATTALSACGGPPVEPASSALSQETVQPIPFPEPQLPSEPPAEPEPSPAERMLAQMPLHEKVCQLFIVFPSDLAGSYPVTQANESIYQALEQYPVGGLLMDSSSMESQQQVAALLADIQPASRIPLLFACDEEGGRVSRLMRSVGTTSIGPMLSYQSQGPETARSNAQTIASDMARLGFQLDFAPVADVWSNPKNTVIGDRAYSNDFQQAAQLVAAAVEGFHDGGVACTLKHFPGHGDTSTDTHYTSAYVDKPLEELRQAELLPFQAGIEAGADAVMLGHLILPEFGDQPVMFSHELVHGLLREELAFSGVVLTDSLKMNAISQHYSSGEAAVSALQAGVDVLLDPVSLEESVQAILQAVDEGTLCVERLDESVLRILRLKEEIGLLA